MAVSAVLVAGVLPSATAHAASASTIKPHTVKPHTVVGSAPTEFYAASGNGEVIGQGSTVDYTDAGVTFTASSVTVTAGGGSWTLDLAAPTGQSLAVGTYSGALHTATSTAPGISVSVSAATGSRSCFSDYGTFTIIELTATSLNATFSQNCDSATAPPLVGFVRYNATTTTPVPTLPSSAHPVTPPANSGTTSANADEFSLLSASGDYIGQGGSVDVTGSNVAVAGNPGAVSANGGGYSLTLAAPQGEQLVPGTYTGATRYLFPVAQPGIDVSGFGRGCNGEFGTFTIYEITTDNTGKLSSLNATFEDHCEQATAPAVVGFIRFNATVPTPVPTLPGPFAAHLIASTGAGDATGKTTVMLDASRSTGAGTGATYTFDFGDGTAAVVSSQQVATKLEWEGTYKVTVTVKDALGHTSTSTPQWLTVGDGYHAVTPTRILDTRNGTGAPAGAVAPMTAVRLHLPSSVTASGHGALTAVVLNVTVTDAKAGGYITVYETGMSQRPATSNLNYGAEQTIANLVTVPLEPGDDVLLFVGSAGSAQLIADLEGYYTTGDDPTNAGFAPLTPTRIMDTRNGTGNVGGRVAAHGHVSLPVPWPVPSGATAVVMNVTVVNASSGGDLRVYPDGPGGVPTVSNINFTPRSIVPNLVIVPIGADGKIDFYLDSPGSADLVADLEGYFSTGATAKFVPSFPTRLLDTRKGDAGGALLSGYYIWFAMSRAFQVPVSAMAAALYNVTVTRPAGDGYVSVVPDPSAATTLPSVSNLNYSVGQTVPNAVLAPMFNGKQDFFNRGGTIQLIVDFFGYFGQPLATDAPPTSAALTKNAQMGVSK